MRSVLGHLSQFRLPWRRMQQRDGSDFVPADAKSSSPFDVGTKPGHSGNPLRNPGIEVSVKPSLAHAPATRRAAGARALNTHLLMT